MQPRDELTIRSAIMSDLDKLVEFNFGLAKETEGRVLDLTRLRLGVKALLEDSGKGWYVVAEKEVYTGTFALIGQLLVTFEWSDWRNGNFWWIQSLYVHPDYREQGVLRQLYDYVHNQAEKIQGSICGFRLYVEQDNGIAHEAYAHLGFKKTTYHMYEKELVSGHPC